uniref:L-proline glycine betaine binding ABC transporter protein ProX n=1 Tax=Vibrio tasmaniensis TaxID=212663 RepID=A0A0H3ZPD1_9VIBR|nr:L-proline glycine betaine binding ABC transporter protein ProX [Vibrio tasmaniensis]
MRLDFKVYIFGGSSTGPVLGMIFELETKIDGNDKVRHAQIKIDEFMSASTKPFDIVQMVHSCRGEQRFIRLQVARTLLSYEVSTVKGLNKNEFHKIEH